MQLQLLSSRYSNAFPTLINNKMGHAKSRVEVGLRMYSMSTPKHSESERRKQETIGLRNLEETRLVTSYRNCIRMHSFLPVFLR